MRVTLILLSTALSTALWSIAGAATPTLYQQPAYESPSRGDPDDLLLLAGYGFSANDRVVYQALMNTTELLVPPASVPDQRTAITGTAAVASTANVPYSLTVRLPEVMTPNQSYALWVRTAAGTWSQGIRINDARPLWLSPAYVYSSARVGGLPRYLKVVGRSMQPSAGHITQVKLMGPQTLVLSAEPGNDSNTLTTQYVAQVSLPAHLIAGTYRVEVARDGRSWVAVEGQALEVRADPSPAHEYSIDSTRFGGCRADDGKDDTGCMLRALAAAAAGGGGTVVVPPGTWNLVDGSQQGLVPGEGIVVPETVSLQGAGRGRTVIVRYPTWNTAARNAAFTLLGHNTVRGFTFHDLQRYTPGDKDSAGPFIQLGQPADRAALADPGARARVDEVTITDNIFDRTRLGVAAGGVPIRRLLITYNEFGAYDVGLLLGANIFDMTYKFQLDDAVVAYNVFKPGSYLDVARQTGTSASQLGAGHRVDFSHNLADGTATDYLSGPDDAHGWRAGYFWHLSSNHELILISQNSATCTGDKIGDGEAISYDNSANTFAFTHMQPVLQATRDTVTVAGPLVTRQNNRAIPVASYYIGHWIQVGDGPGIGQARPIISYSIAPTSGAVSFRVAPAWDVAPIPARSRISVGREYWQVYLLDNDIDQRLPPCQKGNRSKAAGGEISIWAQTADSVVAGNHQLDTDGILLHQNYSPPEHPCDHCSAETFFNFFLDIRANYIDGSYQQGSHCSTSGISADVSAAPWGDAAPPTVGYGLSIDHNTIRHAFNSLAGSAIAMPLAWYAGPEPHRWPLLNNPLIYHNDVDGSVTDAAVASCSADRPHSGIGFPLDDLVWHAVLYANTCRGVAHPIGGHAVDATVLCSTRTPSTCECGGQ